jgi:hypothetical protein
MTNLGQNEASYDSRPDTLAHIETVRSFIEEVVVDLQLRARHHDASKLVDPERATFDEYTPKLHDSTYGSDEYKSFLIGMGEGLRHHYEANDHHPEHFKGGVHDMDLVQLVEMLADWKAATMRHADGDLDRSIRQNAERFGYGPELERALRHTAERLGWL